MTNNKRRNSAILATLLYSVIVVTLLLVFGFSTPLPLPPEEGILIDFVGGGNINAGASSSANKKSTSTETKTPATGVNTQDFEEAPSLPTSLVPNEEKIEKPVENVETPEVQPEKPVNQNTERLNQLGNPFGNTGGGTGSGNAGTGTGSGNPGLGNKGEGKGSGPGGIGGNIGNRRLVSKVEPKGKDNLVGEVKVSFIVDEKGNLSNVAVVSTNCAECSHLAVEAVQKWKYEAKPGSGYQKGSVVVKFKH